MSWLIFAILASLATALFNILVKLCSSDISKELSVSIIYTSGTLVSLVWFVTSKLKQVEFQVSTAGILLSVLAGIAAVAITFFLLKMFSTGVNLSVSTPVVRVLTLIIVSIVGIVFFKENLSWKLALGYLLAISGVYLIAST